MSDPGQSGDPLEFVKELDAPRGANNQRVELYRRGEQYLYVSTVGEISLGLDRGEAALTKMASLLGGFVQRDYPTTGEETMAFEADSDGNVSNWGEVVAARGPGSRDAALEQLRAGVDLRRDTTKVASEENSP